MNVTLKVSGLLEKSLGYKETSIQLKEGDTVGHMLKVVKLTINPSWMLIIVNDQKVSMRKVLKDGDVVKLLPMCGGG